MSLLSCSSFYLNAKPGSGLDVSPQRDSDIGCYELVHYSGGYPHEAPLRFRLHPDTWGDVRISPGWALAARAAKRATKDAYVAVTPLMTIDHGCQFASWQPLDRTHARLVFSDDCCGLILSLTRTASGLDAHIERFNDSMGSEPPPPVGDAVYRKIPCDRGQWYPPKWRNDALCVQPAGI